MSYPSRYMFRSLLFSLLALLSFKCSDDSPKKEDPVERPGKKTPAIPAFDGKKAFGFLLAQTGFGPRNAGSAGHRARLADLRNQMAQYADTVLLQPFSMRGHEGEDLHFTNTVSSFNPQACTRIPLFPHL